MAKRDISFTKFASVEEAEGSSLDCALSDCGLPDGDNFWDATFRLLDTWYVMRGLDPESQRIDRSIFIKTTAPPDSPSSEPDDGSFDS